MANTDTSNPTIVNEGRIACVEEALTLMKSVHIRVVAATQDLKHRMNHAEDVKT